MTGEATNGEPWVYLYGAARCDIRSRTITAPADGVVPGAPVTLLPIGRLAAVFSHVPAAAFGPGGVPGAEWVDERASEHHRVLEALEPLFTLAPMKSGAVWRNLSDVVRLFATSSLSVERMIDRVVGAAEWSVTLHAKPAVRQNPKAASGSATQARAIHKALSALAREASADFGGGEEFGSRSDETGLALDGAYLVEKREEGQFHHRFAQLRRGLPPEYFALRLTGPLPPYNFANLTTEVVRHE